jgi:hypothetical protein
MTIVATETIVYPDSDGKPMADNMTQGRWIGTFYYGLREQYAYHEKVLVAKDHLWYPVRGEVETCQAPDIYVVIGRPKHERGSYKQWLEDDTPLTVAIEIRSPNNDEAEMARKHSFYKEYGVQEYYDYDPETNQLRAYWRVGDVLRGVPVGRDLVSPRLGIRFEMTEPEMMVWSANGKKFLTPEENRHIKDWLEAEAAAKRQAELDKEKAEADKEKAEADKEKAEADKLKAEADKLKAEQERQKAEADKLKAEQDKQKAEADKLKAEQERQKAEADKLKAEQERQKAEADKLKAEQERQKAVTALEQMEKDQQQTQLALQQSEADKLQLNTNTTQLRQRFARYKMLTRKMRTEPLTLAELDELDALEAANGTN